MTVFQYFKVVSFAWLMSGPLLIEKDVQTTISFELELSGGPFNVSTIPDYTKVILLLSIIDTAPIQT